ncbi:unnamed protein product, partial [Prorocentrum cordatum]
MAVSFSRCAPQKQPGAESALSLRAILHHDFPRRLALEYRDSAKHLHNPSALKKLLHYKRCMKTVAANIDKEFQTPERAFSLEGRIGVTMKFIRAVENGFVNSISDSLLWYPLLKDIVGNPCALDRNNSRHLRPARDHAIELAREHALDELGKSHKDLTSGHTQRAMQARQRNARLIYTITPGRSCSVGAVVDAAGEIQVTPDRMAAVLREHWSKIFMAHGIDDALLEKWLDDDMDSKPASELQPFPREEFRFKKKHIRYAILNAKTPAAKALRGDEGTELMEADNE